MQNFDLENIDCHATLAMIEKRWGFPRRTLRALLGMTKSGQSGRSLLPESGADAPAVLSAVYPDSTPAKNRQADVPQYGRSMIEMLGVLAIIGVLSVGGIAGYSKAMNKYRINKAIEQITLIAGNVRSFFAPQKNYEGVRCLCSSGDGCTGQLSEDGCPIIKKAKIFPDEMITVNAAGKITAITNPFENMVWLSSTGDCKNFSIAYKVGDNLEACIELATHDWTAAGVKSIGVTGFTNGAGVGLSDSMEQVIDICSRMNNNSKSYGMPYYTYITFSFE